MSEEEKKTLDDEALKAAVSDGSDENEEPKNEKKKEKDLLKENEELKKKFRDAEAKFEAADQEREKFKNKYYEVYADMANMRKQLEKEADDFKKYANKDFIKELIPSLDAFDMALKKEPEDETLKKYLEGFQMIHKKLLAVLKNAGVELIDPKVGDEYDSNTMEAFQSIDGEEDNKVVDCFVKGYKLKDHLLRAAGVVISKKAVQTEVKEEKKENESKE